MNRLIASVAAITALAVAPAAIAVDRALPQYRLSVTAAAPATTSPSTGTTSPSTGSGSSGSSGSSSSSGSSDSSGSSGSSGSASDGQQPGNGWWGGRGSPDQSSATKSGTQIASSPGVVMIDTVVTGGEGAGTGIVLRSDGIVLTNYHVVEGSTQIRVTTGDSKKYTATVIGYDSTNDIAVLKLADASNLTTATLDTAKVVVGDKVTAIGQGGGQGVLYTASGSVTAVDQQITASESSTSANSETLNGLIETDAQIVPGYSGGPLLDSDGEVVGIDTAASSTTPITGYAIPISTAVSIANKIQSGDDSGTVHIGKRAALGVEISSGSSGYGPAQQSSSLQVMAVLSGGAAEAAGMTAGSIITSIGGTSVTDASSLTDALDQHQPGDKVSVGWTDASGQTHQATVTLGTATTN